MTTINLLTNDQSLIVLQKVKIASGDINSVKVHIDFDSTWDKYTARTATFYTSKDSTVHEVLLTDSEGTVPPEVLAEQGTLHIGVRGVTVDGNAVKTSSVVSIKIVQGAAPGALTLTPTKDLYQQYLSAMNDKLEPVINELRNSFGGIADEKIAELTEVVNAKYDAEINNKFGAVLLWENTTPNVIFGTKKIDLDLSAYKSFRILFKYSSYTDEYNEVTCSEKGKLLTGFVHQSDRSYAARKYSITDTCIEFHASSDNSYCIPVKVYGLKF